jgi:DNA-binding MarR family transcriptional regulator
MPAKPPADFYRPGAYAMEDSVGYLIKRAMQSVLNEADKRLLAHDLTHAQWMPLFTLWVGHCSTSATLARDLQLDPGAMTRALDRLEAKGLVRRERSEQDRRVVNLELTDEGQRLAGVVPAVLAEVLNVHLAGFSHEEWQTLLKLLRKMIANGDALKDTEESE